MNKKAWLIMGIAHFLLLAAALLLICGALGYLNPGPQVQRVKSIQSALVQVGNGPIQRIRLPHTFRDLPPRTPVTISSVIYPEADEEVYVRSDYCPGKVYLNDRLGYEFGKEGQAPAFMIDPAKEVHMIETHGSGHAMILKMEFLSPKTQNRMTINPPLVGSTKEIILERFHAYSGTCILAASQIIYGISLLFISACTLFLDKKGASFLWLGLLSLTTGLWAFGENNFSRVIIKNSTLLYLFAHCGFFSFLIPLLRFARSVVDYENPRPLWIFELFAAFSAAAAFLLQLLGLVALSTSLQYFYVIHSVGLVFLTVYTIREAIRYRSVSARRFAIPVGLLTLTAMAGLVGYLFSAFYTISALAQIGILTFLLLVGVTAGLSLKDSIELKNRQKQLDFEKSLVDIQIKEQQTHSRLLSRQEELLSQQRHDLRHHLNVIQAMAYKDNRELQEYLQTLMDNIPTAGKRFCENQAVNAILAHYSILCSQKGIELIMNLTVPENPPHISSSDLSVIFGNLLENAVEACDRMDSGRKFIRLGSRVQHSLLTVTMDNSFNGKAQQVGDRFRSSKRDSLGIGLASVTAMAKKAGGNAEFKPDGTVFLSSVYLNL